MTTNNPSNERLDGIHGRPATPEEVAQRDGYVQGRTDESYTQNQMRAQDRAIAQSRANENAANGLMTGLLIALLAAGIGAALYFLTGDRTNVVPVSVPQTEKETVREKETTIIEREVQAPDVSLPDVQIDVPDVSLPDVNITNEAPAADAPAAEPATEPATKSVTEPAASEASGEATAETP